MTISISVSINQDDLLKIRDDIGSTRNFLPKLAHARMRNWLEGLRDEEANRSPSVTSGLRKAWYYKQAGNYAGEVSVQGERTKEYILGGGQTRTYQQILGFIVGGTAPHQIYAGWYHEANWRSGNRKALFSPEWAHPVRPSTYAGGNTPNPFVERALGDWMDSTNYSVNLYGYMAEVFAELKMR